MTQKGRIVQYMRDFGSITPVEAMDQLGVMRLAARISDLEDDGYEIEHQRVSSKNRYGEKVSYMRYRIKGKTC